MTIAISSATNKKPPDEIEINFIGEKSKKLPFSPGEEVDSHCIIAVGLLSIEKSLLVIMLSNSFAHSYDLVYHLSMVM